MKRFGLLLLGMGIALALSLTSINLDLLMSASADIVLPSQEEQDVIADELTQGTSELLPRMILEMNSIAGYTDKTYADSIAEWKKVNDDVIGWIDIPDFEISYPVLQGETNKTYLRTDIYGEYDVAGCIFLDSNYTDIYSPVKLLHGHHMANKTMFGKIPDLLFYETLDEAPTIFYTDELGTKEFQIFTVFSVNSKEESVIVSQDIQLDDLEACKQAYIERSWVPVSSVPDSPEMLMLNTCWYGLSGKEHYLHCIVVAARVWSEDAPDEETEDPEGEEGLDEKASEGGNE